MKTKATVIFLALAASTVGGWIGYHLASTPETTVWAQTRRGLEAPNAFAAQLSDGFKQVARAVRPSVVSIESVKQIAQPAVRAPNNFAASSMRKRSSGSSAFPEATISSAALAPASSSRVMGTSSPTTTWLATPANCV